MGETVTKAPQTGKEGVQPTGKEGKGIAPTDAAQEKKFAGARALASKLRGMLRRDNNPEAALKNLPDLRESSEAPKSRKSEAWRKATTRSLLRRGLNEEAITWQKKNKDAVDTKYNELKGDKTDLKPRERFRLRAEAISESMQAAGIDPSAKAEKGAKGNKDQKETKLTRKAVKNSEAYKKEVGQRLDILTAEKGRSVGKIAEIRVKRDVINQTIAKDRQAAVLKVREEQRVRADREKIRSNSNKEAFQATVAAEFKKLNPTGERLSDDKLAEYSAIAQKKAEDRLLQEKAEAVRIAKESEAQQRKDNEAKVIASGEYNDELTRMLLEPKFKDDPDIQKTAMDAAILKMQAREETEAAGGKPAAEAGGAEASGPASPGAEASIAEPATDEAKADAQYRDSLKTLSIDLSTPQGITKLIEVANLFKTLTGNEVQMNSADKNDPVWKQFLLFLASLAGAVITGAAGAAVDAVPGIGEK